MKTLQKISVLFLSILLLIACKNSKAPNGWTQKVNNRTINRVVIKEMTGENVNCATGEEAHIKCGHDGFGCVVIATFSDGSPAEEWANGCEGGYVIFDDGTFTYFYGIEQP